jgi:membrane protein
VLYTLKQRSKSVGIIFFTGLLFLLSTLSDTIISALDEFIGPALMNMDALFIVIVSKVVSFAFVTLWFAVLFRFLPDAKIQWSAIFVGAAVTTVLFTAGKYGLETFLINSNINNIFETSTSIVLILLYIFYSSMIIYFGAAFTKVYAEAFEAGIKTRKYATRIGEAYN